MARGVYVQAERVLAYAVGCGDYGISISPLAHIKKKKKFKGAVAGRERAFTEEWEIETFWRASRHMLKPQKQFWQLLMLTGVRLTELLEASWDEFDLGGRDGAGPVWKIPKARMKQNRDHIVPLTPLMLSILREIPEQPNGRFVFSYSFGERPWCYGGKYKADFDEAVQVEAGKIGKTFEPWVNHDLRRTLRHVRLLPSIRADWETVELLLAHKLPGMTGLYDPFQRLPERRDALTKWGEHIISLTKPKRVSRRCWACPGSVARSASPPRRPTSCSSFVGLHPAGQRAAPAPWRTASSAASRSPAPSAPSPGVILLDEPAAGTNPVGEAGARRR